MSAAWLEAMPADADLSHTIATLLYEEAALLDERQFDAWLGWLAEDVRYRMPVRSNRLFRSRDLEIAHVGEVAHYDEDKASFAMRVRRLGAPNAWAEDPGSRVRRSITNVRVRRTADGDILVRSYVDVYRSRLDQEAGRITAGREDRWRVRGATPGWELVERVLTPDDTVLAIGNLSFWF